MSVDNSHSGVDSKVSVPLGSQDGHVKAGLCSGAAVVTKSRPAKSIEKETCQGTGEAGIGPGFKVKIVSRSKLESVEGQTAQSTSKGTSLKQGGNDQSEPFDTVTLTSEGIDTEAAGAWETEYGSNQDLALSRFWEIEQGQVTDVQGKLRAHLSFWEHKLQPAPWIINCIKDGYKLPFRSMPKPYIRPNQASAIANREFVTQAISELVQNRCVVKVSTQPHVCSPLSVVSNTMGKQRLVINLRYLNGYLWKDKFKYEDMRIAMLLFQQGDYVFSFDLKSGYHHIDIIM